MLPKDMYLYLADFADDITVLNMLSVNKHYYKDEYFYDTLKKRYPLLIKFNYNNYGAQKLSWKRFYVKYIYYISLLRELGIPYVPHPDFDPVAIYEEIYTEWPELYKIYGQRHKSISEYKSTGLDLGFKFAAAIGDKILVDYFISEGATDFESALGKAAREGQLDMVKYLLENYPMSNTSIAVNFANNEAAFSGHLDVLKYLLDYDPEYDQVMGNAIYGGHLDTVKYLLDAYLHRWDLNELLHDAEENPEHPEVVELIRSYIR